MGERDDEVERLRADLARERERRAMVERERDTYLDALLAEVRRQRVGPASVRG